MKREDHGDGVACASAGEFSGDIVAGWLADSCRSLTGVDQALVLAADHTGGPATVAGPTDDGLSAVMYSAWATAPMIEGVDGWRTHPAAGLATRELAWPDGIARVLCLRGEATSAPQVRASVDAAARLAESVAFWWSCAEHHRQRAADLDRALSTRVIIEQAKGFVAGWARVSPERAFELLRHRARSTNTRLDDVARSVVTGAVPVDEIVVAAVRPGSR